MQCPPEIAEIVTQIISMGLLRIRASGWSGNADRCAIEADHLHNLRPCFRPIGPGCSSATGTKSELRMSNGPHQMTLRRLSRGGTLWENSPDFARRSERIDKRQRANGSGSPDVLRVQSAHAAAHASGYQQRVPERE